MNRNKTEANFLGDGYQISENSVVKGMFKNAIICEYVFFGNKRTQSLKILKKVEFSPMACDEKISNDKKVKRNNQLLIYQQHPNFFKSLPNYRP